MAFPVAATMDPVAVAPMTVLTTMRKGAERRDAGRRDTMAMSGWTGSEGWRNHASCLHSDPDLFFPTPGAVNCAETTARAKRICGACPVAASCLRWALDHDMRSGIWGGMSAEERRSLKRRLMRGGRRTVERLEVASTPRPTARYRGFRKTGTGEPPHPRH